jgi:hypothetical protein
MQIRNLMIVMGSAVLCAVLIAYIMVSHYGPSGRYQVSNILLEPSFAEKISYQDSDPQTGKNSRYTFDRFELVYFDNGANRWSSLKLNEKNFQEIYDLIYSDKSVTEVTPDMQSFFYASTPASLTIVVHAENRENTKVLQEIQFADHGDYYRILLRDDNTRQNWVYFYHPKAFELIKQMIKS